MTVLLAALIALGPLSTDMYLASLPDIAVDLRSTNAESQLTLSAFLIGIASGQLIYGPLSDHMGRKRILLAGLGLYVAASIACIWAQNIEWLIVARFWQAVGACGAMVLARAIVRDIYAAEQAARMLSFMGALMGLVPAAAPVLGGVIHEVFGWRANFAAITICGLLLFWVAVSALPETLKDGSRAPATLRGMLGSFALLLKQPDFRFYVWITCLSFGGLFAFISGSSFVFQLIFGLGELQFGLSFGLAVMGYVSGALFGARQTLRLGIDRTIFIGTVALATGGVLMFILIQLYPDNFWSMLAPMIIFMAGIGLTMPQSMAGALTPFPERAGAASSLVGFMQMTSGALVGVIVGATLHWGASALAAIIALAGLASISTIVVLRRA